MFYGTFIWPKIIMDEITDNVGGLSLNAKEWRPGKGYGATTETGRLSSDESAGSGVGWNNDAISGASSWGGKSSV